jgi:hypothetical protein
MFIIGPQLGQSINIFPGPIADWDKMYDALIERERQARQDAVRQLGEYLDNLVEQPTKQQETTTTEGPANSSTAS